MVLRLHRQTDGTLRIDGPAPAEHIFALRFLQRAIAEGYGRIEVTLAGGGDQPVARYRVKEFVDEDGNDNPTAWRCELLTDGEEVADDG